MATRVSDGWLHDVRQAVEIGRDIGPTTARILLDEIDALRRERSGEMSLDPSKGFRVRSGNSWVQWVEGVVPYVSAVMTSEAARAGIFFDRVWADYWTEKGFELMPLD